MVTIKEAAEQLKCSERKIHDLIHRDDGDPQKLNAYRVGRRIIIDEEEIRQYLNSTCRV